MPETAQHGAIACGHALTARAAEEMLRSGGNAVDAAIAAAAMACVVEPVLAGPAGGGFAMVQAGADAAPQLCDFFCQTPRQCNADAVVEAAEADFGDTTQVFHIGPGTVAPSNFIEGLAELHQRHGRLPWQALFAPAIEVAGRGHAVSAFQASLLRIIAPIVTHTKAARGLFAPAGRLLREGETLANPGQARFWRMVASGGVQAWRNEVWPVLLQAAGPASGGHLQEDDLKEHAVCWRAPLQISLHGGDARIWLNPPPAASGVLIALALGWLAGHAQAWRRNLPLACACALDHADALRRANAHDLTRLVAHLPRAWRGTTHISVIDHDGITCAMTISNGEGNGHMLGDFGFMPNNMLGEEDVNPQGALHFPPNVRLSSMMAPTIAQLANGAHLALGSGGSNRIRSALLLVLARLLMDDEAADSSLEQVVKAARLHVEEGALEVEPGLPDAQLQALLQAFPGHRVWNRPSMFFGGVHAVARMAGGMLAAAGDFRRDGVGMVI